MLGRLLQEETLMNRFQVVVVVALVLASFPLLAESDVDPNAQWPQ